ncbi:MAG: hypothetical protein ACREJT_07580, partial [Myxococcota bacterium]
MTPQQFAAYALVLLMPLSAALPLTRPLWSEAHWLYVTPALETVDAPAVLVVLFTWLAPRRQTEARARLRFVHILAALTALGLLSVVNAWLPSLAIAFTLRWALAAA